MNSGVTASSRNRPNGWNLSAGDVRRGVGWQRRGIDRDREARLLDQPRRRQSDHAGPDYGDRPAVPLKAEIGRKLRRCPSSS